MSHWRRALVTGASSGIGEAFADELAERQVDLVLVGRDDARLEAVALRARARGVRADVITADLATAAGLATVVREIQGSSPGIDLLVNNAGLSQRGAFLDLPLDRAVESVLVNNVAVVTLTHAAATRMREVPGGTVIQVSSIASAWPLPNEAVYAASKAFVTSFGQALSQEWAPTALTCTTVLPGPTRTRKSASAAAVVNVPTGGWMEPSEVVRCTLDAAARGRELVVPGARNRLRLVSVSRYPSLVGGRLNAALFRTLFSIRDACFRVVSRLRARLLER